MGDTIHCNEQRRIVFATVGTTCFDALVKAVDTRELKEELFKRGYTDLLIQMGRGTYIPNKVVVMINTVNNVLRASFLRVSRIFANSALANSRHFWCPLGVWMRFCSPLPL